MLIWGNKSDTPNPLSPTALVSVDATHFDTLRWKVALYTKLRYNDSSKWIPCEFSVRRHDEHVAKCPLVLAKTYSECCASRLGGNQTLGFARAFSFNPQKINISLRMQIHTLRRNTTIPPHNSHTYFHSLPSDLLSSEFCKCGYCLDMTRRAACAHTINAFIGRLMWSFFRSDVDLRVKKAIWLNQKICG